MTPLSTVLHRMRWLLAAVLLCAAAPAWAIVPAEHELPRIAAEWTERMRGIQVDLPDASRAYLVAPKEGAEDLPVILDEKRVLQCVETLHEGELFPAAWLVVQQDQTDYDLMLRVTLDEMGGIRTPDIRFTTPTREWEIKDIKTFVRRVTGKRPPRAGARRLAVHRFASRIVTTFVHQGSRKDRDTGGLAALLPEGSLIREAVSVRFREQGLTVALVLRDAEFVPSTCDACDSGLFGHHDRGAAELVLTDQERVLDRLELGDLLGDPRPRIPRYTCLEGDGELVKNQESLWSKVSKRASVELLEPVDADGDGKALEVVIPGEVLACSDYRAAILAVYLAADGPRLRFHSYEDRPLP
ncbi:hypothetical protein ABI59_19710 [Acidobacteria bacterium Mor1]|nr:hypothetical protein ABI59_19710 [Acidobacteria bacterium Mor1]